MIMISCRIQSSNFHTFSPDVEKQILVYCGNQIYFIAFSMLTLRWLYYISDKFTCDRQWLHSTDCYIELNQSLSVRLYYQHCMICLTCAISYQVTLLRYVVLEL